jgi:hypothetical protein
MTWREPVPPDDYLEIEEHDDVSNSGDQVGMLGGFIASIVVIYIGGSGLIWTISHIVARIWP